MIGKNENKPIIIGIIPARGGSKGIPLKNIKLLNGKPLIEYTIETALASGVLDKIIVSTDNDEIARISAKFENIDIVIRPKELSEDNSTTESALIHVCDYLIKNEGMYADYVITLEPTSPLRSVNTIRNCVKILFETKFDSVVGVTEVKSVLGRIKDNKFFHLFPNQPRRRQDREGLYQESSTIYGTSIDMLRFKKSVLGDSVYALIIPKNESFDINEQLDFEIVEFLMKK